MNIAVLVIWHLKVALANELATLYSIMLIDNLESSIS